MTYDHHTWGRVLEYVFLHGRSLATYRAIASGGMGLSIKTIQNWIFDFDHLGIFGPKRKRMKKGYASLEPEHTSYCLELMERFPIAYPEELATAVLDHFHILYTSKAVYDAIARERWTRKKIELRAMEQNAPLRRMYLHGMAQFSARQIVFFDETHVKPAEVRRRYGYSPSGSPALMRVPGVTHGVGNACCAIAAMSIDGMLSITVTEENVTNDIVMACLRDEVLPQMASFPAPNSVLVMDNAPTHDHARVHQLCATFGVICIFLPPYSYDLSPIEPSFHEAKQLHSD
jgi:transposase